MRFCSCSVVSIHGAYIVSFSVESIVLLHQYFPKYACSAQYGSFLQILYYYYYYYLPMMLVILLFTAALSIISSLADSRVKVRKFSFERFQAPNFHDQKLLYGRQYFTEFSRRGIFETLTTLNSRYHKVSEGFRTCGIYSRVMLLSANTSFKR